MPCVEYIQDYFVAHLGSLKLQLRELQMNKNDTPGYITNAFLINGQFAKFVCSKSHVQDVGMLVCVL